MGNGSADPSPAGRQTPLAALRPHIARLARAVTPISRLTGLAYATSSATSGGFKAALRACWAIWERNVCVQQPVRNQILDCIPECALVQPWSKSRTSVENPECQCQTLTNSNKVAVQKYGGCQAGVKKKPPILESLLSLSQNPLLAVLLTKAFLTRSFSRDGTAISKPTS